MPGGLICVDCGRLVGAGEKHPAWCPEAVDLPTGKERLEWREGYEWCEGYQAGFRAAKNHVAPELLELYRARLRKIISAARQAIPPHHNTGRLAHTILDVVERQAERDSLL